MHWIERHILKALAFSDSQRYSELKPDGVEGNLFQYHARLLEKRGLIGRTSDGYSLTPVGKTFVADLSQTKLMHPRKLPRVVVMIAAQNDQAEYLLFKWRRQPYRGLVSLPFGRQLYESNASEMATEQLLYKAGYKAVLSVEGVADITTIENSTTVDHLISIIFRADKLEQVEQPDGLTGESFWGRPADFASDQSVAGLHQIISWLKKPDHSRLIEIVIKN